MSTVMEALLHNLICLLLLGAFIFMTTGIGLALLKKIELDLPSSPVRIFFSFPAGTAITGYAIFILASAGLLYPLPLYTLLSVLLLAAIYGWNGSASPLGRLNLRPADRVETISAAALSAVLLAGLVFSLAPETGRDSLIYHLNLPKLFLKNHGFYFVPGNIYANFPLHSEMLYLIGLFLQGDILAKLMHFTALLFVLFGMIELGRMKMGAKAPVYFVTLLFVALPTVFHVSHMAYVDLFVTLYVFAAVWAFLSWHERKERKWLVLAGIFGGTAMACKYTALFLPVIGIFGVLWHHRDAGEDEKPLHDAGLFLLVLLLFGTPFYIKSWLVTGNPLYPFFYTLFGGRGWEPRQAELFDGFLMFFGMGRSFIDFLLLPWNISVNAAMHTPRFDGVIGPVFLLLLPLLAAARPLPPWLRLFLVYSCLAFLFWASSSQQLRFLIPVFPFLAISSGYLLLNSRSNRFMSTVVLTVAAGGVAFNLVHIYREITTVQPAGVAFGTETRDAYLRRSVSSYAMYDYINRSLPAQASIFLVNMKNMVFLCNRNTYSDTMFESYTMQKILSRSKTTEEVYLSLKERGFSHLLYDELYFLGEKSVLLPEEKALFARFAREHLRLIHKDVIYQLHAIRPSSAV